MIKVVIFDFFGVFCTSMGSNWFKRVTSNDPEKMAQAQMLFKQSDLGQLSLVDFHKKASKLTGVSIDEIDKGIEAEKIIDTGLVKYVQQLKDRGFRVACLSNGSHEWTLRVINDHEIGHLFEEVVLSSDIGIVKPDLKIYKYTLKKLNIAPSEAIFVDDRQANVEAGETCGIRSLLFTDTPTFIDQFEEIIES